MNLLDKILMFALIGTAVIMLFRHSLDILGLNTVKGEAVVTGCKYRAPHTILSIKHNEKWLLQMLIRNEYCELSVDKETCQVEHGKIYHVKYVRRWIDGRLSVTEIVK